MAAVAIGEALTCIGCEAGIAAGAAHLRCSACLLAAHPHCTGSLFQPAAATSATFSSSSGRPLCQLCRPKKRPGPSDITAPSTSSSSSSSSSSASWLSLGPTASKLPRLGAANAQQRPGSPPAVPADTCAICLAGGIAADSSGVVSAESCQLHRCHLACLATWLESAPSGRAGRCPGLGCGASLAKLRIRRPGNEEIVESARLQVSCPICLEQLSGPVATPDTCPGHQFCPPCLRAWTGQSRLCPYDRRPFGSIHLRLGVASDIVTNDEPLPELPAAVADPTAADAATDTGISDDEVNNDFGNDEDDDDDEDDSDSGSDGGQIDQAFGFADLFEFEEGEFEAQEAQVDLQPQALPFVQIDTNTFETDSDVEAGVDSNSEDAENSHVDNFNGNAHGDDVDANANSHYHDADSHLDVANTDSHGDDAYVDADFHDLDADAQLNDANADSHGDDSFADADYHSDDIYADADSRDVNDYSQLDDVNADNADSHADANFHFDYVDADADSDDADAGTAYADADSNDAGPADADSDDAGPDDAGPADADSDDAGPANADSDDADSGPAYADADVGPAYAYADAGPADADSDDAGPADADSDDADADSDDANADSDDADAESDDVDVGHVDSDSDDADSSSEDADTDTESDDTESEDADSDDSDSDSLDGSQFDNSIFDLSEEQSDYSESDEEYDSSSDDNY